jgi:DeoR family transcriptional regulator, deoxyribose operon repressor
MPAQKRRDRFHRILQFLQANRGATLAELAAELAVSEMTVRRDLEEMAADGLVRIVHTGAILAAGAQAGTAPRWSLAEARAAGSDEMMRIGSKAASLVDPGDTIIVDCGATGEWLVRSLPERIPVTVVCWSLNVLVEARRREGCSIVLAGGSMREDTLAFESPEGVQLIRRLRANKAFLDAAGANERLGVTCAGTQEAEMKKAAVASAQTRVLAAHSDVFGRVAPAWFAEPSDFDVIVTDAGVSLEYVEVARSLGIALHVV